MALVATIPQANLDEHRPDLAIWTEYQFRQKSDDTKMTVSYHPQPIKGIIDVQDPLQLGAIALGSAAALFVIVWAGLRQKITVPKDVIQVPALCYERKKETLPAF